MGDYLSFEGGSRARAALRSPQVFKLYATNAFVASKLFKNCYTRAEGVCGARKRNPKTVQSLSEEPIEAFARKLDRGSKESNQGPRSAPPGRWNTRDLKVSRSPGAREMLEHTRSVRPKRHRPGPGV